MKTTILLILVTLVLSLLDRITTGEQLISTILILILQKADLYE